MVDSRSTRPAGGHQGNIAMPPSIEASQCPLAPTSLGPPSAQESKWPHTPPGVLIAPSMLKPAEKGIYTYTYNVRSLFNANFPHLEKIEYLLTALGMNPYWIYAYEALDRISKVQNVKRM